MPYIQPNFIHKVPVTLNYNIQHDSHTPYCLTSVTWLQLLRKQTSTAMTSKTHWYKHTHDFAHYPYLWRQLTLANITCARSWRLCGITPLISPLILNIYWQSRRSPFVWYWHWLFNKLSRWAPHLLSCDCSDKFRHRKWCALIDSGSLTIVCVKCKWVCYRSMCYHVSLGFVLEP